MPETARIIGVFTDIAPYSEPSGPYALVLGIGNVESRESDACSHCPAGSPPNPTAMSEPGLTAGLSVSRSAIRMVSGTASRTAQNPGGHGPRLRLRCGRTRSCRSRLPFPP